MVSQLTLAKLGKLKDGGQFEWEMSTRPKVLQTEQGTVDETSLWIGLGLAVGLNVSGPLDQWTFRLVNLFQWVKHVYLEKDD